MNAKLSLPNQKNYGYELAYKLACEQLGSVDIKEQCHRSGARYVINDSKELVIVQYLNQPYQVTFPTGEVSLVTSQAEVPIKDKILILHYLILAKGTPLADKLIAFSELPEGANYFPTFSKRSIEPLIRYFGQEPEKLEVAAKKLGGQRVNLGDVAVTIPGFSRVPVTVVLWRGDEEFSARGSILFDASISSYLSTYDITVLCENITWRLIRSLPEDKIRCQK